MPILTNLGMDPVFFGIVFSIATVIGYITPPFGLNLFYMKAVAPEVTMRDIYISVLPYCVIMIFALLLCVVFPVIPMVLPNTMK
jgi:TRAP-type C4-dicarboxylate transport system permease large subunit